MRLSPKQLRLIFAKLRAKGKLLDYSRKLGSGESSASSLFSPRVLDQIMTPAGADDLVSRLPFRHHDLAGVKKVRVYNTLADLKSAYPLPLKKHDRLMGFTRYSTGEIHIVRDPNAYILPTPPLHDPKMQWSRGGNDVTLSRLKRNAQVGIRRVLYHEYAHSVEKSKGFSGKLDWKNIAKVEWISGKGSPESWSNAYALYATSRTSRTHLKRDMPLSYDYMKKFFEMPDYEAEIKPFFR